MATFWITRLRIVGKDKLDAEISFGPNLNVITGASDTGKSYVLECIRYMTGGGGAPETFKQSKGYTTVLLEIETSEKKVFVLQRSLKKGNGYLLYENSLDKWNGKDGKTLKAKHSADQTDNVSQFLLSICNLRDVIVTVKKTENRTLRFSDITNINIVDEDRIGARFSPLFPSEQFKDQVVEKSVFDFLVSGEDSSSVIVVPDAKIEKAGWRAKRDLFTQLIEQASEKVLESESEAISRLEKIDASVDEILSNIASSNNEIADLQKERETRWKAWHVASSRQTIVSQLLVRFELLEKHYKSDIERLSFLAEADHFLSQIGDEVYCPVCGKLMSEHPEKKHDETDAEVEIQNSARIEIFKLNALINDLSSTMATLQAERDSLEQQLTDNRQLMDEAETQLNQILVPRLKVAQASLQTLYQNRNSCVETIEAHSRIKSLTELQVQLGPEPKQTRTKKSDEAPSEPASQREFFEIVQDLLNKWKYTPVGVATFNEKLDLVIAGQTRAGHGQGVRAILHSAFTMALMQQAKGRHPGFVVLDSPLTSYRPQDKYESTADVQRGFFEHLIEFNKGQVIIIENKEPPDDLVKKMRYQHFSGVRGQGRQGFFPEEDIVESDGVE